VQAGYDERELRRSLWPLCIRTERSLYPPSRARVIVRAIPRRIVRARAAARCSRGKTARPGSSSPRRTRFTHPTGLEYAALAVDADGVCGRRDDGRFGFTCLQLRLALASDDPEQARRLAHQLRRTALSRHRSPGRNCDRGAPAPHARIADPVEELRHTRPVRAAWRRALVKPWGTSSRYRQPVLCRVESPTEAQSWHDRLDRQSARCGSSLK
jgi:hypothetical protein